MLMNLFATSVNPMIELQKAAAFIKSISVGHQVTILLLCISPAERKARIEADEGSQSRRRNSAESFIMEFARQNWSAHRKSRARKEHTDAVLVLHERTLRLCAGVAG